MTSLKIEFEGTDGAGKTTGIKYFVDKAKDLGLTVLETREVGNTHIPTCVKLRELVLDPHSTLSGESMEFIFAAMRVENDKWFKAMSTSGVDLIVSDRGYFSHLAYGDHNCSVDFSERFFENLVGKMTKLPDMVVYFDVSTETALKRRVKRGGLADVIESKGVEFQEKVRGSFAHYLNKYTNDRQIKLFTVNANAELDLVKAQLDSLLQYIVYDWMGR